MPHDDKVDTLIDYHPVFLHGAAFTFATHYEDARAATDTNNSYAAAFVTFDLGARYSMPVQTSQQLHKLSAASTLAPLTASSDLLALATAAAASPTTAALGDARAIPSH